MKKQVRPGGVSPARPFLRELTIKDPLWTRARAAFGRLLMLLRLRRRPPKFADREHWAPMVAELARGRVLRGEIRGIPVEATVGQGRVRVAPVLEPEAHEGGGRVPAREFLPPPASGSREAIRTAVLAVPGVTSCQWREDDGTIPPYSFELMVEGGEDSRVAEAIFLEKAAGMGTCGTTSVAVSPGNVVRFTRPARARRWRMEHPRLREALELLVPTLIALALAAAAAWVLLK